MLFPCFRCLPMCHLCREACSDNLLQARFPSLFFVVAPSSFIASFFHQAVMFMRAGAVSTLLNIVDLLLAQVDILKIIFWRNEYICCSVAQLILCDPMNCRTPGLPVLHYLPELAQTHVHWVGMQSNHLILCHLLLLLPSIFPSIRVFSNE